MIKNQPHLIPRHGGYRDLKSFQHAELVYDATVKFCEGSSTNDRGRTIKWCKLREAAGRTLQKAVRRQARRRKQNLSWSAWLERVWKNSCSTTKIFFVSEG